MPQHRRPEHQRRPVRAGQGDVLRDHLAEHDVQVDDDRQRDHERDRVQERLRHVRRRASTGSTRWATAGSPTAPSTERADRDAELVDRRSPARCSPSPCSVVRAIRDPASARGSIWVRRAETRANSAPTKKALPSSRKIASSDRGGAAHRSTSCGRSRRRAGAGSAGRSRRPSMRSTRQDGELLARLVGVGAVGHPDLGEVADARAPGRAPAAPGRRSVS